jgi:hypothetical protein
MNNVVYYTNWGGWRVEKMSHAVQCHRQCMQISLHVGQSHHCESLIQFSLLYFYYHLQIEIIKQPIWTRTSVTYYIYATNNIQDYYWYIWIWIHHSHIDSFSSYLTNTRQVVEVNHLVQIKTLSLTELQWNMELPQGSIPRPILFTIYIHM